MLRITQAGTTKVQTLDLEGKLVGPWVSELRLAVAVIGDDECVRLNLRNLTFADAEGLALLRELRRNGTALVHASPLILGLLELIPETAGEPS